MKPSGSVEIITIHAQAKEAKFAASRRIPREPPRPAFALRPDRFNNHSSKVNAIAVRGSLLKGRSTYSPPVSC